MFDAAGRFVRAVHKEVKRSNTVIMYHGRDRGRWMELADPDFRRRVMELLVNDPYVINPIFAASDSFDDWPSNGVNDWTFTAYRRPPRIDPGHCIVCNHHAIDYSQSPPRCHNISCKAEQKPTRVALWISARREPTKRSWLWLG